MHNARRLYEWYILAQKANKGDEYNIESVDMEHFFWIWVGFMIEYRFLLGILGSMYCTIPLVEKLCGENGNRCFKVASFVFGGIIGFVCGALELGLFVAIFSEQKHVIKKHDEMIAQPINCKTYKTKQQNKVTDNH